TANDLWRGDWYMHDQCSDIRKDPLWYAPDLIRQVMECRTPQEIGTHSFSHINFSAPCSTPELVRRELEACLDVMQPFGLRPRSLVFPFNVAGYSYLRLLTNITLVAILDSDHKLLISNPTGTESVAASIHDRHNPRAT